MEQYSVSQKSKRRRRDKINKWLEQYKRKLSCVRCGLGFDTYPELCEFHHIDPTTKQMTVTQAKTRSVQRIKQELQRCVPLCANCHSITHAEMEREHYKQEVLGYGTACDDEGW